MDQQQMSGTGLDLGKWLTGAAAGALLMYMLDPERGRARRAATTDKIMDVSKQTGSTLSNAWERVGSRLSGAASDAMDSASRMASTGKPDGAADRSSGDTVSRVTEAASEALGGRSSPVSEAASELPRRMGSAMQGMRGSWAPGMRSSALLGGGLLGIYGLMRRSPLGIAAGLGGLALLARSIGNQPLRSMLSGQALSRPVDLEKTIHIDASPDEVYDMFSTYENFPRFMSHVIEVRDLGRGRSHWVVKGPAGSKFEWDSKLTEQSRPQRLGWRSEPDAEIPNSGSIQFEPSRRGGTNVTVRMTYSPPAGMLGHGLASLLGVDPKRQMDDDLAHMKAFIERGVMPHNLGQRGKSASRFLH